MVDVYVCQLPEKRTWTALEKLLMQLPAARQIHIRKFHYLDDAYRSLIRDYLLHYVLKEQTGKSLKDIDLEKNVYGKPYLPKYPSIQFNISHSGKYVVCAVHNQKVGIDVERVLAFDLSLAKHLFTTDENHAINRSRNKNHACYEIWTLKESYTKAIGMGLAMPLPTFGMSACDDNMIEVVHVGQAGKPTGYRCKKYRIAADYKLAVCAYEAETYMFAHPPNEIDFDVLRKEWIS